MTVYTIDTAATLQRFKEAGLDEAPAKAIVDVISQSNDQVATKADIQAVKADIHAVRADIAALKTSISTIYWVLGVVIALNLVMLAQMFEWFK